jgi:hypothetical protein
METSVAEKAPHLLPVVQVVRDGGVGFLVIPQRATGLDRGDCAEFCALAHFSRHWEAVFEHNRELAFDRVPFSD